MVDYRREAVLIVDRTTGRFEDRTADVATYRRADGKTRVAFKNRPEKPFHYGRRRAQIIAGRQISIPPGALVSVDGAIWRSVTEVWEFEGPDGSFRHAFYRRKSEEVSIARPAEQIDVVVGAQQEPAAKKILLYWRTLVNRLPADDPLRPVYDGTAFVHPESALARYLRGARITTSESPAPAIFPFRCNLSQREAVDNALRSSVSVIEGPPGTGKTETILNLLASIVAADAGTVGV
ncbi:MAG: AAA domain-containing protein, partial [Dermatophilaceae bacterium]